MCLCLTFSLLSKQTSGPLRYLGFCASSHGSGPSAEDARSGKMGFSLKQHIWNNTVPTFISPANKGLTPPTHKALAASIPSFILFQMFSNLLLTFTEGGVIITHAVALCAWSIMLSAISLLCSWQLNYKYFWETFKSVRTLRKGCVCMCAVVLHTLVCVSHFGPTRWPNKGEKWWTTLCSPVMSATDLTGFLFDSCAAIFRRP